MKLKMRESENCGNCAANGNSTLTIDLNKDYVEPWCRPYVQGFSLWAQPLIVFYGLPIGPDSEETLVALAAVEKPEWGVTEVFYRRYEPYDSTCNMCGKKTLLHPRFSATENPFVCSECIQKEKREFKILMKEAHERKISEKKSKKKILKERARARKLAKLRVKNSSKDEQLLRHPLLLEDPYYYEDDPYYANALKSSHILALEQIEE